MQACLLDAAGITDTQKTWPLCLRFLQAHH
jgi:hypothetical protein